MRPANYDLMLDRGWNFCLGDIKRYQGNRHGHVYGAAKAGGTLGNKTVFLTENEWKPVRVPHDWLASLPYDSAEAASNGFKKRGRGWYYTLVTLPDAPIERARLVFEGVLGETTVYVNGTVAVRNFSGYNRFTAEIADYLLPGEENLIALSVDGSTWEAWSYEGAGLYRPAYVEFREETRLDTYGCFVRGTCADGAWTVDADLPVLGLPADDTTLSYRLEDPSGAVLDARTLTAEETLSLSIPVRDAALWSPEAPTLYRFSCELCRGGAVLDTFRASVGFRTVEWRAGEGMLLNGEHCLVKGICCHQDHGGVGAAVTPELMEYRIRKLKSLGINAYRCAHHAVPDSFLDVCDRLGMLVMVENRHYAVSEDVKRQLESLVRVARNHPSVFIYSLFNEEPWQADVRGYRMAKELRELVRSLDGTRAVTGAMNGGTLTERNASDAYDVIGMNYYLKRLEETHLRTPDKVILGTENAPTYATRGEYETDAERCIFTSYCDDYARSFSESLSETMELCRAKPYHAGNFIWSGIDGYGEPQPYEWPSIASHWGMLDLCGFEKSTAYLLSAWYREDLCVRLVPHWNHEAGETVRVVAFTNGDSAELFLNGRSLGEVCVREKRAEWQVPFEKGSLSVVARRGAEECSDGVVTAGAPACIVIEDATPETAFPRVRILNLSVTDASGVLVPDFSGVMHVSVTGAALLGASNGDPNGHTPLSADTLPFFHGRAQIIVSAETGCAVVSCEGLPPETAIL